MEINSFTRRFLLIIYNLGEIDENGYKFIKSKTRLIKLYNLLVKPEILKKVLEELSFDTLDFGIDSKEARDTIFRHYYGAYLVNFANKISEALYNKLIIQKRKIGGTNYYILKKSGEYIAIKIMEKNDEESNYYKEVFTKMLPLKAIKTQKLVSVFNKIIRKGEIKIGTRIN